VTVNALPTVSLTSPTAGASFNAPATVTVTANAADSDGTVTKVDFYDGATLVGTATAAPFTVTLNNVAAGAHTYTAVATDNRNSTATSAAVAISVNAPPAVSITTPAANAILNAPGPFTVTATATDTDGTVTKVDFFAGATLIGTATSSPYTIQWSGAAPGAYSLTAVATDSSNATTTSAAVPVTVNALPTVSLTSPAAGATFNSPATVTVTANAADADGTVTKVDFYDGATLVGTATAAPFSITLKNVAAGSHSYTAVATDNRNATATSAAVAITVNAPPTVSITAPAANASFNAPATITVTATAADTDGTITKVDFYQGVTLIGTATASPYTIQWANVAAGSYTLTAVATDNANATTTSATVAISVNAPPTVAITAPAAGAVISAPASITVTAAAADSDGTLQKVDFYQGATLIGTATASPYTIQWTNVAAGAYSLTAVAIDNANATTTSAAVAITVNALPTVAITAPTAGTTFGAPATITVTATAADADGTIAKVDFYQGSTLIGTATASPYTISWTNVAAGSYSLTAIATDNLGGTATSAAVAITVSVARANYFIHPDHLNTGREIYNQAQQLVWRRPPQEPFGDSPPDENLSSLGAFEFPLRDEGTYADKETNLLYNWNRYRDLNAGRFIQADPLGLYGGDLSLYVLTKNNPLSFTDPDGLQPPGVRLLGQPGPIPILPPGPLGVLPGQPGYVFPLVPPSLTARQKCMLECDVVVGSPCKYIAYRTPGMPYGPIATYLACNYAAHEICARRCDQSNSCSVPYNDPSNPDFPRIPPMANDPSRR
jgi:RHS repeat-associated protein